MSIARIERVAPLSPIKKTAHARRRAPRHPIKPEKRLRKAVRVLFTDYHRHLVNLLLAYARRRAMVQLDDGTESLDDTLKSAQAYGYFLAHSVFMRELLGAARATADSARKQTARAIKKDVTTELVEEERDLADWISKDARKRMEDSIERAREVYDQWDELPDDAEAFGDEAALEERLDAGLDGITGAAIAYASLVFGGAFGDMIKEAQTDSGVSTYTWLSQMDSHVREAHAALDGEECSWDDPPLKADVSDNGEDDHPGDDWNCRCVASPNDPDEADAEPN